MRVPNLLGRQAARGPAWAGWLETLPRLVADVLGGWGLVADGPVRTRGSGLVLPVRDDGRPGDLVLGGPEPDAAAAHLALRAWDGAGAVQLLRADPRRRVLLLERCEPGHDLADLDPVDACAVVAGLYPRLHRRPVPSLDRLSERSAGWADALAALHGTTAAPRRFVDQAVGLAADFAADPGTDVALVHGDLHTGTVLAASREPWLAVDPHPLAGEPSFEVAPLLWTRWDEAVASGDLRGAVLDRLYAVVDTAGLDEDRTRAWVTVRVMVALLAAVSAPVPDREAVTRCTTLVKAVQR
ncbi:streptomycin 6-kinase [Microlunatus capsulatus]